MTIDITKQYQTRDGRKVRILCTDAGGKHPIVGLTETTDGWCMSRWAQDGAFYDYSFADHQADLIEVRPKRTLDEWVNVYPSGEMFWYHSRGMADKNANPDRIACLHITREYEEGEGLEK